MSLSELRYGHVTDVDEDREILDDMDPAESHEQHLEQNSLHGWEEAFYRGVNRDEELAFA